MGSRTPGRRPQRASPSSDRRQALVARRAEHSVRPQADARQALVEQVSARHLLRGALVHAVERSREPRHRALVAVIDGDRRRIDDVRDAVAAAARRLEHVRGADDVDRRSGGRVGAAERHLERSEVNDARHRVLVDRAFERCHVGDVDLGAHEAVVGPVEHQAQPRRARGDIGGDRDVSAAEHLAEHPGADATVGAGDEKALLLWRVHDHLRKR